MSSARIVTLNVGGSKFTTCTSTLTKYDGMLKTMFTTDLKLTTSPDGTIFIDRDATHFRKILNYLRDGHISMPASATAIAEIRQEAAYYMLEGLVALCDVELAAGSTTEHQEDELIVAVSEDELMRHVVMSRKDVLVYTTYVRTGMYFHHSRDEIQQFVRTFRDRFTIIFYLQVGQYFGTSWF